MINNNNNKYKYYNFNAITNEWRISFLISIITGGLDIRIKFSHLVPLRDASRRDFGSSGIQSLSDVSDYAYLTIPSIIAQVSHVYRDDLVALVGKTFLPRIPWRFLSENFSRPIGIISTLVTDNRASTCHDSVARCTCTSRKWHALRLIFRAMDIRGKLQGEDPGTTRRDKDRETKRKREGERERETVTKNKIEQN